MSKNILIVSDLHINSTVALCYPELKLDDGGIYTPSQSQKWLYSGWYNMLESAKDKKPITIINGDALDLNKHSSHQLISKNKSSILKHALLLLQPLKEISERIFIVRGTSAHTGESSEIEETLAMLLGAETNPDNGNSTFWSLLLEVEDVLFDIAHHGRIGVKPWTRQNSLNALATEIMVNRVINKARIPDLAIRSHYHTYADTNNNFPVRVIQTPGWQLSTEYSYRIAIDNVADVGYLMTTVANGSYEVKVNLFRPSNRVPVKLQ